MLKTEQAHVEAMFKAFAPAHYERWCYLLARKPNRWGKISPIDIWPLPNVSDSHPKLPLPTLLSTAPLAGYRDSEVVVLRCGHSENPGISSMLLRAAFPGGDQNYDIIFEGFVSVVAGKLALGLNHEGGIYLFRA